MSELREDRRPPAEFWREVPCGHPQDPVAWVNADGGAFCHCGWGLNGEDALSDGVEEGAPGPIVSCSKCGCYPAVPKEPSRV